MPCASLNGLSESRSLDISGPLLTGSHFACCKGLLCGLGAVSILDYTIAGAERLLWGCMLLCGFVDLVPKLCCSVCLQAPAITAISTMTIFGAFVALPVSPIASGYVNSSLCAT